VPAHVNDPNSQVVIREDDRDQIENTLGLIRIIDRDEFGTSSWIVVGGALETQLRQNDIVQRRLCVRGDPSDLAMGKNLILLGYRSIDKSQSDQNQY
jgi:hypothetical protein